MAHTVEMILDFMSTFAMFSEQPCGLSEVFCGLLSPANKHKYKTNIAYMNWTEEIDYMATKSHLHAANER